MLSRNARAEIPIIPRKWTCGRICHVLIGGGRHAGIARSIDGDGVGRDEDKHKSLVR